MPTPQKEAILKDTQQRIADVRGIYLADFTGMTVQSLSLLRKRCREQGVQFRVDKGSNVHAPVGKASFSEDKLLENAKAFLRELMRAKPSGAKGHYVKSLTMSSTMGPGITLDPSAVTAEMA